MGFDIFGVACYAIAVRAFVRGYLRIPGATAVSVAVPWAIKSILAGIQRNMHHEAFFTMPSWLQLCGVGVQCIIAIALFIYLSRVDPDAYLLFVLAVAVGAMMSYMVVTTVFRL